MENKKSDDIQWHNALLPGLQLELEAYFDDLRFESRHELNTKHLEIDLIVIVLKKDIVIDNPIARIFKTYNIFEYKSPTVSLSIADFQRALSYVMLYDSIEKDGESKQIDIDEISLSIITTIHPKAVFDYIETKWHFKVEERESGIYIVEGFPFPLQFIENKRLSKESNIFLRNLNTNLDSEDMEWALKLDGQEHRVDISGYIDILTQANPKRSKEDITMPSQTMRNLILESPVVAEVRASSRQEGLQEGLQKGKIQTAKNLIGIGLSKEEIAKATELDIPTVESLYTTNT
jgi:hypothetical protein